MSDPWDSLDGKTQSKRSPEHLHRPSQKDIEAAQARAEAINPVHTTDLPPIPKYVGPAQKPSIGRIVHFILPDGPSKGEHRPAIIVKTWATSVQLQVFTNGENDGAKYAENVCHAPSVQYADESENKPYSWHWPERV